MTIVDDTIPTPSGWTRLEAEQTTGNTRLTVFYRFVTRIPPVPASVTALALVLTKRRGLA